MKKSLAYRVVTSLSIIGFSMALGLSSRIFFKDAPLTFSFAAVAGGIAFLAGFWFLSANKARTLGESPSVLRKDPSAIGRGSTR
jgi:hypothetical protein